MLKATLCIALFFGVVGLKAQTRIDQLTQMGDSLMLEKKQQEGLLVYREALTQALDGGSVMQVAQLYKKIGVYHYRKKEYEQAEQFYRKSLRLDTVSKTAADGYYNIGLVKRKLNQLDSVFPYLERSMALYGELEPDEATYNAYLTAGILYKNKQLYDTALRYLIKADNGFAKTGNYKKQIGVANTIGAIHSRLRNYRMALQYQWVALNLGNELERNEDQAKSYSNIGNTYFGLKEYDSALMHYKKALSLTDVNASNRGKILRNMANSYAEKGDLQQSLENYKASLNANKKLNDTTSLLYSYNGITHLLLGQGDTKKANAYLDTVSKMISRTSDLLVLLNYYKNKASYDHQIENYKRAFEDQTTYSKLYEQIYNLEQAEAVQNLQSRFEYEKKVNENLQLSLANQNNLLLIEKQKSSLQNKNWMLALLGLSLFAFGIGYYVFRQRQKVKAQEIRIEKLEAIYQGQETIKKRIARDLHDVITTNFDGLRLKILAFPRAQNIQKLSNDIAADLTTINQQIRHVSHRLSPLEMHVKERPFTEILKSRFTEFQLYRKVFVYLDDELPAILNELDFEAQNNVYSIVLEALNNVDKHAKATELQISCEEDKLGRLHLKLIDNGIGLASGNKKGIGLMNIHQRAELLGGKGTVEKMPVGTKVHLIFPVKES